MPYLFAPVLKTKYNSLKLNVLHDMVPDYLRQLISVLPPSKYDLRGNHDSCILLASPKVRTFSCAALRLWNLLPSTMQSISSLNLFKNRLITFLFGEAFN